MSPSSVTPGSAPAHLPAPVTLPDPLALRVGYAGLAPFVLGALLALLVRQDVLYYVSLSLSVYAGMLLSLLGGVHWTMVMLGRVSAPRRMAWAVIPTFLGWVSVVMPPHAGLVIQGLGLVACYLVDRRTYPDFGLSKWLTMRFRLTAVAALCCFLTAAQT